MLNPGIELRITPLSVSPSDVCIYIMHYTHCLKSKMKAAFIIRVLVEGYSLLFMEYLPKGFNT